jgi:hypothetical protein
MAYEKHEVLSRSESGLHYVRDRKSGILKQLTEEELREFSDPPPCEQCGEQFGCDHYNCAREPLLTDAEIEGLVPKDLLAFAKENGMSRNDLERLRVIEQSAGEYRVADGHSPDMRTLELVLELNAAR